MNEPLDVDHQPTESRATPADPQSDSAPPEHGLPLLSSDTAEQPSTCSAEVESDNSSPATSPSDDDRQHSEPKADKHPENGKPGDISEGNRSEKKTLKKKRKQPQFSGRRSRQPDNLGSERVHPTPTSRPELVCKEVSASAIWELLLSADEHFAIATVNPEGAPLDFAKRQYRIPSLKGSLTISSQDGEEHVVPLFEGAPLIFKLRKNWAGKGHKIARITSGHFIVFAPNTWKRTGHAPVEPCNCNDPAFKAHYFYRDATASDGSVDGFCGWNDSLIATSVELAGQRVFDDSDDGMLFVGNPPNLESSPEIEWARVGKEDDNGWGQNFRPDKQSLPEVLAGREGLFFFRVYDSEVSMLDSAVFRYLRNLGRIHVDGAEYTQDTVLVPTSTGYPCTEVRFIGTDKTTLSPMLPHQAPQTREPSGAIKVPPHPCADRISCSLGSEACCVNIILDLPRIWWRLEDGQSDHFEWCDTPLNMTREEFRNHAYSKTYMSLLSKRFRSVRVGFDDNLDQQPTRKFHEDRIAIYLSDFVDYAQIDQRLNDNAHFNVKLAEKILPLIVISADPRPNIISFTAEQAMIFTGQEAILNWKTKNAGDSCVAIDPDVGVVESDGSRAVCPADTTKYTLKLTVSGIDDIIKTVTVTVDSPPKVMSRGRWRIGKGFSYGELQDAGVTVKKAADHSISIDRRRRTSHRPNVETIRSKLDVRY